MECRDETFAYGSPPSGLLAPGARSGADERFCRTVHGPVQERAGNVAYARRYAIWDRELETLVGPGRDQHGHEHRRRRPRRAPRSPGTRT